MADELAAFGRRLAEVVSPAAVKRMVNEAGKAGKKSALDAAADSLGGDRAFSGWRRKVSLSAGYDDMGGTSVRINFRPAGMWMLAERGRRGSGTIRPRGKQAVMTPEGPRARSSWGSTGGHHTYTDAVKDAQRTVPKAAAAQFTREVAKAVT